MAVGETRVFVPIGSVKSRPTVVVGSGPAGAACASALAAAGVVPLVLDGGAQLEPARVAAVPSLLDARSGGPGAALLEELRASFPVGAAELPLKPAFGSLYPYAPEEVRGSAAAVPSLGVGGLSSVWGGAMLPYGKREHEGWPFGPERLAQHYRSVLSFVPLAGEADGLATRFPLYVDDPRVVEPTPQVASFLGDLAAGASRLAARRTLAGRSRLALWTRSNPHGRPCERLGLCLVGCPNHAIYNTAFTIEGLARSGKVSYRSGAVVRSVETRGDAVLLRLHGGEEILAERVFLAAGPLGTTRIALASLGLYDQPVRLRDSAYFTMPLLRLASGGRVGAESAGLTLAQAFVEIDDPDVSPRNVHLQVYGFNDLMLRAAAAKLRLSERHVERLLQPVLARLLYVQGYLHSDLSPGIDARLVRDPEGDKLVVDDTRSPNPRPAVRRVVDHLRTLRGVLRAEPAAPLLQVWPAGKGFHFGGSFPMRERPRDLETDILGRLPSFERVHLVDSSVFPTVPALTITLAAMANAHRIAHEVVG